MKEHGYQAFSKNIEPSQLKILSKSWFFNFHLNRYLSKILFQLVSALFSSLSTSFRQAGAIDESNFFCYLPCFAKSESLVQDIEKVAKEEAFNKFEAQLL